MSDASGYELSHPLRPGDPFGLQGVAPRRCVGLWRGTLRSCPFDALIAASGSEAQCEACAAADPGRALARDAVVDDRDFRLYVATFGADALKVGISAVERGDERLLEQGALAFTWIAQGSHRIIRAADMVPVHPRQPLGRNARRKPQQLADGRFWGDSADQGCQLAYRGCLPGRRPGCR